MRRLELCLIAALLASCVRELPPEPARPAAEPATGTAGTAAPPPSRLAEPTPPAGDPLLAHELRDFKVVAVITGMDRPLAAVEAPDGRTYTVRVGTNIGRRGGRVVGIATGRISVEEACAAAGNRCRTELGIPPEPRAPRPKNLLKGP